jgi:hypothetical protein
MFPAEIEFVTVSVNSLGRQDILKVDIDLPRTLNVQYNLQKTIEIPHLKNETNSIIPASNVMMIKEKLAGMYTDPGYGFVYNYANLTL